VVIAQSPSGNIALMVDSLLGQQEIVIKALDDYVGDTPGIAGATILGDGRVVLIIDVLELMNRVGAAPETPETMEAINA
jgi:two-component system chemotaxis sensor kinase CheA